MRRLDWFLAAVIGLFLAIAVAVEANGWASAALNGSAHKDGHLAATVAADIARLPVAGPIAIRYAR
jgi:hypothetical protein